MPFKWTCRPFNATELPPWNLCVNKSLPWPDLGSTPFQPSNLPLLCTFWWVPTGWPPYFSGGGFGGKLHSSCAWNHPNPFQYLLGAYYQNLGLARVQRVQKIAKMAENAEFQSIAEAACLFVSASQSIRDTKDAVAPLFYWLFTKMTSFCIRNCY